MSFWLRELFGWLLIALALFIFFLCVLMLLDPAPRLLASGPLVVLGIFVFRGGIHLLKVAIAARVAMRVQQQAEHREETIPNKGQFLGQGR